MLIADGTNDAALAETAARQIEAAYETLRDGGDKYQSAQLQTQLPKAQAILDRLKGKVRGASASPPARAQRPPRAQ